jgi:hypothetical protein
MKVEKPIFIIGTGRCGSTIFHNIFSQHPNVAWLSRWCNKYPDTPSKNRFFMKAIDYPIIGNYLKKRFKPRECWDFWEFHFTGFRRPFRDLLPEDVTNIIKEKIQNTMVQMLTSKRDRLLIKITGWPRIGFIHEIFEDAKFIHILRDGRAVANSLINERWWLGWQGPHNWRWGELSPSQKEEWEKYDKSFIALAGIEWKILMDAMENAKKFTNTNNFLEVRYENLCANPSKEFNKVVKFCDLQVLPEFENIINELSLKNSNYKWQKMFTDDQQRIIEDILRDYLKKYHYL